MVTLHLVATVMSFIVLALVLRLFYLLFKEDYEYKKRCRERERKRPKAFRKAEYDCTENFYHD